MSKALVRRWLVAAVLGSLLLAAAEIQGGDTMRSPARLLLPASVADDLVLYRLRDRVLAGTPGGRRAVDLFYDHIGAMASAVTSEPELVDLGVGWLAAWEAPLSALVEGRGAQATLGQAQVDSLLAYVEAMKAAAEPSLRAALAREQERLGIGSWAGMNMDQWLRRINRLSCAPSDTALCLAGGRFRVEAQWRTGDGRAAAARAVGLTPDTGYFWFFGEANVEAVVKVLDACGLNQRFWVFAGGLTNVEVDLTVADTWSGNLRTYRNALDTPFQPLQDTAAFRTCAAVAPGPAPLTEAGGKNAPGSPMLAPAPRDAAKAHACTPSAEALCLQGGRFRVETEWRTAQGASGRGQAVALTPDTGYFWFFDAGNVEEVVKVVDACGLNSRRWVFATGLTNVRVVTRVTDTHTGVVKTYTNPQGQAFRPLQDTSAFSGCG